jgi:hypothetical protein
MPVYPQADTLEARVEALEEQLRQIANSPQLGNSSIRGGTMYVLDANRAPIVSAGVISDPGGAGGAGNGLIVQNPTTTIPMIWAGDGGGLLDPYLGHDWRVPNTAASVVSGTMVAAWESRVELVTCKWVKLSVTAACSDGTTSGEMQLVTDVGPATAVKAIPLGSTVPFESTLYWTHGLTLESGPINFQVTARRTAGAGQVFVYTPRELTFGNFAALSSGGGW